MEWLTSTIGTIFGKKNENIAAPVSNISSPATNMAVPSTPNTPIFGGRRSSRRKQGGGAAMHPGDANAGGMLLTGRQAAGAEAGMNAEWQLAKNPASFAPK